MKAIGRHHHGSSYDIQAPNSSSHNIQRSGISASVIHHLYGLSFSMWVSPSDRMDVTLHDYTRVQSTQCSAPDAPLESIRNWRGIFPQAQTILELGPRPPGTCDILLVETSFQLMTDFPPRHSKLGISLMLDFNHPNSTSSYAVSLTQLESWSYITSIYQHGKLIKRAAYEKCNVAEIGKITPFFESLWWVKTFTTLTERKRRAEDSKNEATIQAATEASSSFLRGLSVVQEIFASSSTPETAHGSWMQQSDQEAMKTHKHIAILLWRFSQALPNCVGTTTWRKLVSPPDRMKINSPPSAKQEVFPTMSMDDMVDEMTTTTCEGDSHGFFLDHGTHLPEYYPSTSQDLLGHVDGAFDDLNNFTAFPDSVFNVVDPHSTGATPQVDDLVMQDFNHLQYNLQAHGHNGMFTAPLDAMAAGGSNYFDTEIQRAYSQPIINPNLDHSMISDTQPPGLHHTQSLSQPVPDSSHVPYHKLEDVDEDDDEADDLDTVPPRRPLTTFDLTTHQILQAQLNQSPTNTTSNVSAHHHHQNQNQPAVTQSFDNQLLASLSTNPPTSSARPRQARASTSQPQPYLDRDHDSDHRYWHAQSQLLPDFDMSPLAPPPPNGGTAGAAKPYHHHQSPSATTHGQNVTQYAAPVPTRPIMHSHASYLSQHEALHPRPTLIHDSTGLTQDMLDVDLTHMQDMSGTGLTQDMLGVELQAAEDETAQEHQEELSSHSSQVSRMRRDNAEPEDGAGDGIVDHELIDANALAAVLGAHNAAMDAQGLIHAVPDHKDGVDNDGGDDGDDGEGKTETAVVVIKDEE